MKIIPSKERIREFLNTWNAFKAAGLGGIHFRVVKELDEEVSEALTIIFANAWMKGNDCRRAKIGPLFKRGKRMTQRIIDRLA